MDEIIKLRNYLIHGNPREDSRFVEDFEEITNTDKLLLVIVNKIDKLQVIQQYKQSATRNSDMSHVEKILYNGKQTPEELKL